MTADAVVHPESPGDRTRLLAGPTGAIEYLTTGAGAPATVFGHGLAGSISTTRPFGSGVPGSRTFLHFRGHGASHAPESDWTYAALAAELRAVADHVGATRALGVSMGAGALCRLVAEDPTRFERLVLVVPAALDRPRSDPAVARFARLAELVDAGDATGLAAALAEDAPPDMRDRPEVVRLVRQQARLILATPVGRALRTLPQAAPLDDGDALRAVTVPALVVAQESDDLHPVQVALELGRLLPAATVEILPPGGVLWSHRRRVRALVSAFLRADDGPPTPG